MDLEEDQKEYLLGIWEDNSSQSSASSRVQNFRKSLSHKDIVDTSGFIYSRKNSNLTDTSFTSFKNRSTSEQKS